MGGHYPVSYVVRLLREADHTSARYLVLRSRLRITRGATLDRSGFVCPRNRTYNNRGYCCGGVILLLRRYGY